MRVGSGVGKNRIRRAQQPHQRLDRQRAEDHKQYTEDDGQCETGGSNRIRLFLLLRAQLRADQAQGAHANTEAYRLDNRHQGKYNADGSGSAGSDLRYKVGISGIVDRTHKLAACRRNRHGSDQTRDRRLGHTPMLFFFCIIHSITSLH